MQEAAVALLVCGALGYLTWRFVLRLNKKPDCGTDCGCEPDSISKIS